MQLPHMSEDFPFGSNSDENHSHDGRRKEEGMLRTYPQPGTRAVLPWQAGLASSKMVCRTGALLPASNFCMTAHTAIWLSQNSLVVHSPCHLDQKLHLHQHMHETIPVRPGAQRV